MESITSPGSAKPFPNIVKSLVWIVIYFLLQIAATLAFIVGVVVSNPAILDKMKAKNPEAMGDPTVAQAVLWGLILSGVVTLLLMWFNLRKDGRAEQIGLFAPSKRDLPTTLGIGVLLVGAVTLFNYIYATYVIPGVELQDDLKALLKALSTGPLNILLKYLAVAGMAPLLEELLFRGYLQNSFMRKMKPGYAIALASLIFAAVHFQPLATPALFVMGAAFGYLYHLTGSLKTNIALHALNNAAALYFTA
jgi:membrane protease YdiL (CAAX protease family)